ncbi:translation initiation factor IF-3 [Candidatus Shikimatogenerans silvanidophilus]|uniref:translation initiation factor IF-3 n=1 Tax=Candidatus Shikimatogenerans silvanidophilus TaxID=2782547 RepID=UPI001BB346EA|nr:translation initiation factor IF-3 [Candidatus Shikimatogenerans silvanidophilus]
MIKKNKKRKYKKNLRKRKFFYTYNKKKRINKINKNKINNEITSKEVRLVGNNIRPGIYNINEALIMAKKLYLDLIEINSNLKPPICKIFDYNKFLYEKKKKIKKIKYKKIIIKEIRLGPQTGVNDLKFKLKIAKKFLENFKAKVKFSLFFKGRTIIYKEQGKKLLFKCADYLKKIGIIEKMTKIEGKKMFMLISPKKNKNINKINNKNINNKNINNKNINNKNKK